MSLVNPWDRGLLGLQLLAQDPSLGGIIITCRASPVRDRFLQLLPKETRRIHPQMEDTSLFGGLDITATLSAGQVVLSKGIAQSGQPLLLTMAERTSHDRAAQLVSSIGSDAMIVALDETADNDAKLAPVFEEHLAFHIDLSDLPFGEAHAQIADAQDSPDIAVADAIKILAQTSVALGISSLRASTLALKAARGLACLDDRKTLKVKDLNGAAALVLAHRATQLPDMPAEIEDEQLQNTGDSSSSSPQEGPLEDQVIDAIKAVLPNDIMSFLSGSTKSGRGQGTGYARKSNRRGRPARSRQGRPGSGRRLDVIATMRAAAPYQALRQSASQSRAIKIRPSDLHIKTFEETSDRLITFAVDASGSSASGRLAEAKGAVEYLLTDAYARRDHVALVAFRGQKAELLLSPTRSLVQTKRRLASLPGGGGTPLASGIELALMQAISARQRGMTPTLCFLTDGRANVDRTGQGNRKQAGQDAIEMARLVRSEGIDAIIIDTSNRPEKQLRTLATVMDATYISLPRADAAKISTAVTAAIAD